MDENAGGAAHRVLVVDDDRLDLGSTEVDAAAHGASVPGDDRRVASTMRM
jgi:hypothetical protein